jgi:hypothetical protein
MRRDHFNVATRNLGTDETGRPTLDVEYTGPSETLTDQLTDDNSEPYSADAIDAAFRLQGALDAEDVPGVFSLTHRITGEYLLELNAEAETVLTLVRAVRDVDEDDASYRIRVERDDSEPVYYEMDTLFVYDENGDLLRQDSLIPSGVEL